MGRYPFIILCLLGGAKETDLIYEGIATLLHCAFGQLVGQKETDLKKDEPKDTPDGFHPPMICTSSG